jgi:L-asparaginase II
MSTVLAEVVRSGFVESRHRGSAVALGADGAVIASYGEIEAPIFPRSSAKPVQAAAMVRAGLDLHGQLLALAAASHSAEPFHLDGVRRILAHVDLGPGDLQNPPDWPLDDEERQRFIRAGAGPTSLAMNCSGKHAAMLATCVLAGWPTATYRDPEHPLQTAIRATLEELAGEKVSAVGVDGCGVPLFAISLHGLARAFSAVGAAGSETAEGQVAAAMRAHPTWVAGTRRDDSLLMAGVPGLIAKAGAEGIYAAALPDGRSVALKLDDGGGRARPAVMAALLRRLGVDADVLAEQSRVPVLGGGRPVGELHAVI